MGDVEATNSDELSRGGGKRWQLRPLTHRDIDMAMAVIDAADAAQVRQGMHPPRTPPSPAQRAATHQGHARFVERDAAGAWVAVSDDDRVVGVTESIRRGHFWGLSTLFVHPEFQSKGVGRELLDAALGYAAGARARMIHSSADPRAMRRYALAGLAMHPAAELGGAPDRRAIPAGLAGRPGDEDDLDLVAEVDARLGRSRAEDVAFALEDDRYRLDVVDERAGRRGWVLWHPARLLMLGATDEDTAVTLLWRYLAGAESDALTYGLTSHQNWAFSVAHSARLTLRVGAAMFVDGMGIPGPWIPSGWYF
jgi:GNAT superfamily N-acetyltransferase